MPVYARMKLVIEEECYARAGIARGPPLLVMKYVGPGPQAIYPKAYEFIKSIFHATDEDIEEETYDWGKLEKEKFKVSLFLHKDLDKFTYLWINFIISGEGTEKEGKATVIIRPLMRTEYPQDTLWQRTIFYEMLRVFWHRVFYHNKRREYVWECRNLCSSFQKQIEECFKKLKEEYG